LIVGRIFIIYLLRDRPTSRSVRKGKKRRNKETKRKGKERNINREHKERRGTGRREEEEIIII
jgi:hypothetical protein